MSFLQEGKRIINIDETWLNETSHIKRSWAKRDGVGNVRLKTVSPRLSLIAAMDTDGRVWFSLTHANTDSNIMALFLHHLKEKLDQETPGWEEGTYFQVDNAPYHTSEKTRLAANLLRLKLIFSGPYSYSAAPIELLFSAIKHGELNPEGLPTSKK